MAALQGLFDEIARLTTERDEKEKDRLHWFGAYQELGAALAEDGEKIAALQADLAAARAALERLLPYHPHPPYPEGHQDHPHVIIVSALAELGTGEALHAVRVREPSDRQISEEVIV